ncbi:MAG: fibronectin type III domain-containing protein, partial [Anaerobutyricum sp.]|nr:fibronectin type III domain-containing protein [Anaerobutyricum sp.]
MKSIKNQMIILCIVFLGICLFTGKENVYAANNRYIPEKFEVEKKGNSSVTLRWKPVSGVKGYVLYQYNTKSKKYERIKKVTDKKKKKITLRNLKGRKLKFRMRTYRNVSGRKKYGAYSPEVSVYMKKNKRNVSDIILKKAEYSIEKGSTIRLKYKLKPLKKLGSKKIVFSSTRPEIASVDSLGRVKAKAAGVTYIVLRSHNGKQKKIKITVT